MAAMRPPIFVRSLSDTEKEQLQTASAYEFADRVCGAFGCTHEPHLSIPREAP